MFVCGDVENARDTLSLWYHAMYDAENLYLLARWKDTTPLNNPGVTSGDFGFHGDCLQTRVIVSYDQPDEKIDPSDLLARSRRPRRHQSGAGENGSTTE